MHPIVDVVFPGIHFDSVRAKDRKAGFIPYVESAGRPKREFHRILTADRQPHIKSRCEHLRARGYEMASRSERLESFWPNLSLRPGLTDARRVLAVGEMDTDPLMWPWYFETEFACRYFIMHNDTATGFAIPDDPRLCERISADGEKSYVHTYSNTNEAPRCATWCTDGQHAHAHVCIEEECKACDLCARSHKWCGVPDSSANSTDFRVASLAQEQVAAAAKAERAGQCGLM